MNVSFKKYLMTHPWQGTFFMERVLGVDGALSGTVGEEGAAWRP